MTYLFDTNAWLRLAERPETISPAARLRLDEVVGAFPLSVVSIWEVGLKARKGKLQLTLPLDDWLAEMTRPAFVRLLPVDAAIARLSNTLPGNFHDDPADRFIVATAIKHNLTIVTSDQLILAYPHVKTLDTR